jgi:hypothetical protein
MRSPLVVVGDKASNASVLVVWPVPPLAMGSAPVTPVDRGSPVALVSVNEVGVPRLGVVNVGLVAKTNAPDPVSSVTAAARFADEGVPKKVKTPVPVVVVDGARPAPPPITSAFAVSAPEEAQVDALEK